MTLKEIWKNIVGFLRTVFRIYEKEIRAFVENMIEMAFQNLDAAKREKITPAIRKKIANKILADIIVMGIDTTTNAGKSEIARIVVDALSWAAKESE